MIQRLKERRVSGNIYQIILGKAYLKQDMAYGDFQDLPKRAASEKLLNNKVSDTA